MRYTQIHIDTQTYIYMHTQTYTHRVGPDIHIHTQTYTDIHRHTHAYIYILIDTCPYTYTPVDRHRYTYRHTHRVGPDTYMHTHRHMYVMIMIPLWQPNCPPNAPFQHPKTASRSLIYMTRKMIRIVKPTLDAVLLAKATLFYQNCLANGMWQVMGPTLFFFWGPVRNPVLFYQNTSIFLFFENIPRVPIRLNLLIAQATLF